MGDVKAFGARIVVVDPPAEEQNRASGLLIPAEVALEQLAIGIVVHGSPGIEEMADQGIPAMVMSAIGTDITLKSGMLVYYRKGTGYVIRDVRVIDMNDIVAFEEAL